MSVAACGALLRVCRQGGKSCPPWVWRRESHWQTSLLGLRTTLPMRAEPRKKKKIDPKRDQLARDRLKKKLKKMERVPPELIPIDDFIPSPKLMEKSRIRPTPKLSEEEQEKRALLIKKWARVKQEEHEAEQRSIESLLEAQRKALDELRFESEELYQAAVCCDPSLFPLEHLGPCNTAPIPKYSPPDGKYNDITEVHVQH